MKYKVKVIIPYDFLVVKMNVIGQADIDQYEECLAFALSDRWDLDDLDFLVSKDVEEHSFSFSPEPSLDDPRAPSKEGFSVALQEGIEKYMFLKDGHTHSWKGRFGNPTHEQRIYRFTPPMTNKLEDGPPSDEETDLENEE